LGCDTYFFADIGNVGGAPSGSNYGAVAAGGGGGISPASNYKILNGDNLIGNIKDYNKCFTNVGGNDHLYQVTICVAQPKPGTREAWGLSGSGASGSSSGSNPVNVGHAFLIFSETTMAGTITRNVGLYPQNIVNPYYPSAQAQLNNDANHSYNISLTVIVTNGQFFNMLNYVDQANNPGYQYNMNSNNCTTFGLQTLRAGNVYLPSTFGSWANGSGNDPGDLGEDIRSMYLSPGMTRNINQNAHPNVGTCL
jgi:hypothetical protein